MPEPKELVVGEATKGVHPEDIATWQGFKGEESGVVTSVTADGLLFVGSVLLPQPMTVRVTCTHELVRKPQQGASV